MSLAQDLHDETYSEHSEDLIEPVDKNWKAPWGIAAVILSVECCERLCYYTFKGTMKTFLQQKSNGEIGLQQASAMSASASTLCYLWCVPGGWLADTIGRYKVIFAMSLIYCFGSVLCVYTAGMEQPNMSLYLAGQLAFIAIGTGGMKPNISSFGADQFAGGGAKGEAAQASFFSFFYLAINVGSFCAFTFLVNMATTKGYFTPFAISCGAMIIATVLFISATPCYKYAKTSAIGGTETMAHIAKHFVYAAVRGKRMSHRVRGSLALIGWLCMPIFLANSLVGSFTLEDSSVHKTCSAASLIIGAICEACLVIAHLDNAWITEIDAEEYATWCDCCWFYTFCCCFFSSKKQKEALADSEMSTDVELDEASRPLNITEIRATVALVPLLLTVNTCFGLCYNSMDEAFPSQACQMDCRYNPFAAVPSNYTQEELFGQQFNGAMTTLGNSGAIIIGTPFLEVLVYPFVARFTKSGTCRMGMKLVSGLIMGAGASFVAAALEIARKHSDTTNLPSNCGVPGTFMRAIPAYWMFLPMAMIGIAEILVNPILIGHAYMAAPPRVRSTVSAFNLLASGCLSHAFTATLQSKMFPENPDEGYLEDYYMVNGVIGLLGIFFYFVCTHFPCGRDVRPKSARDGMEVMADDEGMVQTQTVIGATLSHQAMKPQGTVFADPGIAKRA